MLGQAKRVRIYVSEDEKAGARPAHLAILQLLRKEGAAGATCFRGLEGFGSAGELHVAHLVDVPARLPVVVEWVDAAEAVDRLLPRVRDLVEHGVITVEDTEVVFFAPHPDHGIPPRLVAADAMTRDVVAVDAGTRLRDVVSRMLAGGHRAVPVVSERVPVGVITHGDLLARGGIELRVDLLGALEPPDRQALLSGLDRSDRTAADVMTPSPVTIRASTPLREAADLMARRRLKRLPVVDASGKLAGVLSRVDVLRVIAGTRRAADRAPEPFGLDASQPVANVMRRDAPTVLPDSPLPEVFQAVVATRLNRALVVDEQRRVLGVVSDGELLERLAPPLRRGVFSAVARRLPFAHAERDAAERTATARTAKDLMHPVPTTRADTPLRDAIALVLGGAHKLLAVVDADGRLAGVLDRADLLRGLLLPRR
jgi:CBS domain-containing protein